MGEPKSDKTEVYLDGLPNVPITDMESAMQKLLSAKGVDPEELDGLVEAVLEEHGVDP